MLGSWPRGPRALSALSHSPFPGRRDGRPRALPTRGLQGDCMHVTVRGHLRMALRGTRR